MQFVTKDSNGEYKNQFPVQRYDKKPGDKIKTLAVIEVLAGLLTAVFYLSAIPKKEFSGLVVGIAIIISAICLAVLISGFGDLVNQSYDSSKYLEDIKNLLSDKPKEPTIKSVDELTEDDWQKIYEKDLDRFK